MPGEMDLSTGLYLVGVRGADAPECLDLSAFQWMARVRAYIQWPRDEARRKAAFVDFLGFLIAATEEYTTDSESRFGRAVATAMGECIYDHFRDQGGFAALQHKISFGAVGEWYVAGIILGIIRSITEKYRHVRGPGTWNKSIYLIDIAGTAFALPKKTKAKTAWRNFKSVSHLIIAFDHVCQMTFSTFEEEILTLLSIARDYQRFAVAGPHPIIDPADLWLVPDRLDLPELPEPPILSLPQVMVEALRCYAPPT